MKKIFTTMVIVMTYSICIEAQNYIYHGENQYASTTSWKFEMNATWISNPEITIAKHSNGGYLMISIGVPFKSYFIGGTVFVFLKDGSTIKCNDIEIKDYVDRKSIVLYNFTMNEIEKLKQNPISKIRFSIIGGMEGTETFTADNKKMTSFLLDNWESKKYYETDKAVQELFE